MERKREQSTTQRYFNLRQAAEELRVSVSSVSRWIHSGRLHGTRSGKGPMQIRASDVERLKSSQESEIDDVAELLKSIDTSKYVVISARDAKQHIQLQDREDIHAMLERFKKDPPFAGVDREKFQREMKNARAQRTRNHTWP